MNRPAPKSLEGVINDLLDRVRQLETNRFGAIPDVWFDGTCTSVRGNGAEEDPRRINLKLDPDTDNQIECREDGLFVGGGQQVGWDAVVDNSAVASDPENRLFQGIGEALEYLNGLGLVSVGVAVRATTTVYVETADWNTPARVQLYGIRGDFPVSSSSARTSWDWNDFQPVGGENLHIANFSNVQPKAISGTIFTNLAASKTRFRLTHSGTTTYLSDLGYYEGCTFNFVSGSSAEMRVASTHLETIGCDFQQLPSQGGTQNLRPCPTFWLARGCMWQADDSGTKNLIVEDCDIDLTSGIGRQDTHVGDGFTTINAAGARMRISLKNLNATAANDFTFNLTNSSTFDWMEIYGDIGLVTITGSHDGLLISANAQSSWDITGPANINTTFTETRTLTLRGGNIVAQVAGYAITGSSGTFLTLIDCRRSVLNVASGGANSTGTKKSYSLDASCDGVILFFAGDSTYPVAGTDAGTSNIITVT